MEEKIIQASLPSSAALAYLGDAVHSLDLRRRAVSEGFSRSEDLHRFVTERVNAASQARMLLSIEHLLSEDERATVRRAANSHHLQRPKHTSGADYRMATGLEAVFGMLHFRGEHDRIRTLFAIGYESADPTKLNEENKEEQAT
jgi:ribonuclease-3 family protein